LKEVLTESLNEYLRPLRRKRAELEKDPDRIKAVLTKGIAKAREVAAATLDEVRSAMDMQL
jgi:tryptophanyl-tRNA synthetase